MCVFAPCAKKSLIFNATKSRNNHIYVRIIMEKQHMLPFVILLVISLTGCAGHTVEKSWPEPRPLGKDIATYQLPSSKSSTPLATPKLDEPKGVIALEEALSLALKNNPALAASSWELRVGEAREVQAGLLSNPELEVEVENFGGSVEGENTNGTKKDIRRFDEAEVTVSISQLFETGGKRSKRKKVASLEHELLGWDHESTRLDILTEVTNAFIDLLAVQEKLPIVEDLVHLSEDISHAVSERVKAGKVSPIEETRAKVELSTITIEREKAKRDLNIARKKLAVTWGITLPSFQSVRGDLYKINPIQNFEDLTNKISQNPEIARWTTELEQRQATLDNAKADRIPDLTLGGGVRYVDESEDNVYVMAISLPLPILNRNQGEIQEARYNLYKAKHEQSVAEIRMIETLNEAYQSLSAAFFETTTLKDVVLPAAQSEFDAVNEGYNEGKFDYLNLLHSKSTFFDAKLTYIESLATYHKAVATIERLIGEKLDTISETNAHVQRSEKQ
jgi:cobalt-zinc-cadmium efflux system outer membrane protein